MATLNTQTGADTAAVDAFHQGKTSSVSYKAVIDGKAVPFALVAPHCWPPFVEPAMIVPSPHTCSRT